MNTNEKPVATIATPIDENVEAIAGLLADEQNDLNTAQKAIERFSSVMAAPAFWSLCCSLPVLGWASMLEWRLREEFR